MMEIFMLFKYNTLYTAFGQSLVCVVCIICQFWTQENLLIWCPPLPPKVLAAIHNQLKLNTSASNVWFFLKSMISWNRCVTLELISNFAGDRFPATMMTNWCGAEYFNLKLISVLKSSLRQNQTVIDSVNLKEPCALCPLNITISRPIW